MHWNFVRGLWMERKLAAGLSRVFGLRPVIAQEWKDVGPRLGRKGAVAMGVPLHRQRKVVEKDGPLPLRKKVAAMDDSRRAHCYSSRGLHEFSRSGRPICAADPDSV